MTVATEIYYSGVHPYTLKPTFAPKTKQEKEDQHRFFFWYKNENKAWIKDKLRSAGKPELAERLLGQHAMKDSPKKPHHQPKKEIQNKKEIPKWLADRRKGK